MRKLTKDKKKHFTQEDILIESKHIKRCSISLVIRKKQIKTTMSYRYIPIRIAKIKKESITTNIDKGAETLYHLHISDGNIKCYMSFWNAFGRFFFNKQTLS
jgi:hypothetical protein